MTRLFCSAVAASGRTDSAPNLLTLNRMFCGHPILRTFNGPAAVSLFSCAPAPCCTVLNDFTSAQQLTITMRLLSLAKSYPSATPAACASELQPVKVLSVQAPPNFAKWLWSISVDDLLQSQPGCTRTTCYVHVSTALPGAAAQGAAAHSSAPVGGVKLSAAEAAAPAALWPTEGTSPHPEAVLSTDPAAAAAGSADGSSSHHHESMPGPARGAAVGGVGPVPDVQLLLASPRDINFLDPGVVARKSTGKFA